MTFTLISILCIVLIVRAQIPHTVENAISLLTTDDAKAPTSKSKIDATEDEINNLRIEFIKAEILKKLQIKETPQVSQPIKQLPKPVMMAAPSTELAPVQHAKDEDTYATTNQVILLASSGPDELCEMDMKPSTCFRFNLPADLTSDQFNSTQLWIYKLHDIMDNDPNVNQTFVISEFMDGQEIVIKNQPLTTEDGWVMVNLDKEINRWIEKSILSPALKVTCITCGYTPPFSPLSLEPGTQPLITIDFQIYLKKKRPKRNINCMAGVKECCREKLYVNFKDIGWDDWVMEPRGYHAYFCKGSCISVNSAAVSASVHNTVIQKMPVNKRQVGAVPCCAATEHSPITLIYRADNHTVTRTTLYNMVVESCGCM